MKTKPLPGGVMVGIVATGALVFLVILFVIFGPRDVTQRTKTSVGDLESIESDFFEPVDTDADSAGATVLAPARIVCRCFCAIVDPYQNLCAVPYDRGTSCPDYYFDFPDQGSDKACRQAYGGIACDGYTERSPWIGRIIGDSCHRRASAVAPSVAPAQLQP